MTPLFDLFLYIGLPLCLILIGAIAGGRAESRHLRQLDVKEKELADVPITDLKTFAGTVDASCGATMVMGNVVIASDYLKSFLARIKSLLGGELTSYQSLMNRARREAIVRVKTEARSLGHNAVANLRIDFCQVGAGIEVLASGTAYTTTLGA